MYNLPGAAVRNGRSKTLKLAPAATAAALALWSLPAFAQMYPGGMGGGGMGGMGGAGGGMGGMGGMPGGMGGPTKMPGGDEKDGPAEQAPEADEKEPMLAPMAAYPGQASKRIQFLQLEGYFRFRSELWHNFHLGFVDPTLGTPTLGSPFAVPTDCYPPASGTNPRMESVNKACDNGLSTTNMRFRLEPTFNVTERMRVKAQIDLFDNLVLGSTPENALLGLPTGGPLPQIDPALARSGMSTTQVPQQAGRNSLTEAIQVKRAWAEVDTPLGELKFGRMPFHFGMGMGYHDGRCFDCDFGTTADRISFSTQLLGYTVAGMFDWAASGASSAQLSYGIPRFQGQPFDGTNRDDVAQYSLMLGKFDPIGEWKDKIDRFGRAFNYGLFFSYRSQELDSPNAPLGSTPQTVGAQLIRSNLTLYRPVAWLKLYYRHLVIEAEGTVVLGDYERPMPLRVRQGGGVGRISYGFLGDSLKLTLEGGFASGDQVESARYGQTHYLAQPVEGPGDAVFTRFNFNPDYHVDLILFRRIIGAVTNAIYAKPSIRYDLTDFFAGELSIITSFPHVPVATPGNGGYYGMEIDTRLMYQNVDEGFLATLEYGVFFPGTALNQPNTGTPAPLFPTGLGDASTAQTLRLLLGVKF